MSISLRKQSHKPDRRNFVGGSDRRVDPGSRTDGRSADRASAPPAPERQAGEALPHARWQATPHPARQRDHRTLPPESAATAAINVGGSTAPVMRSCTPPENAISIVPPVPARAVHAGGSGVTETAANCTLLSCRGVLTAPNEPVRACRRQTVSKLGCTLCRRATSTTLAEGTWLSSTIRCFSIVDHRRRRSGPDRTETLLTFAHLLANQSANYRSQGSRPEGGPDRTVTRSVQMHPFQISGQRFFSGTRYTCLPCFRP